MAAYRFYEIDAGGRHPYVVEDCASDEEALRRAEEHAALKQCVVEVWCESRFIGKRGGF
jgi:hypothetical protein